MCYNSNTGGYLGAGHRAVGEGAYVEVQIRCRPAAKKAEEDAANATNWPVIGLAVAAIAGGAFYYMKNVKN